MGVSTNAYFKDIDRKEIFEFIQTALDTNARYESRDVIHKNYSNIHFKYRGESRMLHVHKMEIDIEKAMKRLKTNDPDETDDGNYVDEGLPDKSKGTLLSFGFWGHAAEIMKVLALYFNGYIDESDSDAEDFYFVKKDLRELMREIWSGRPIQ